jgi:ATPase family associated with various cellular activities (AAA)
MRSDTTQDLLIARIRARARLLARRMERLWAEERSSPDQGLVITAGEVERLLEDPAQAAAAELRFRATDPACVALAASVAQADAALAADACWSGLCDAFGLAAAERDFLNLVLAAELDCVLQRVIAYLHDDTRKIHPTPWLAAQLFDTTPRGPAPMSALLRWRLAAPIEAASAWWPGSGWRADPAVVLSVAAGHWRDPALDDFAQGVAAAAAAALPCLHPRALEELLALADPTEIELVGTDGIGRQTLAAQFAAARGLDLLVVDSNALLVAGKTPLELAVPVLRMARQSNAIAYWRDADAVPAAIWTQARALGCMVMRGRRQPGPSGHAIMLDALPTGLRYAAWAHWSTAPAPTIVTTQRLTPAEIQRCASAGNGVNTEAMRVALRRAVPVQSELLTLLPCPYDWDDLVVHADVERQLREFETQVRLRWSVMEEWGFDRLAHLGHGISALFGGPSGTGKTMAAQVLARALGLDLYRVDLAGVINKYVGETEKRLRDVFDACERAGALLFFDEADALFGSRMQVKEAHDRFANIEIDYLLQRIERFDGVAILATNRKNDLDPAFLRRLRFVVEFLAPRPAERLALWRRALLPEAPSGDVILDDIDWDTLAERLQLTGADIKSAALAAAFLARAEGERIGMRHVLAAAQRELTKHGATMRVRLQEAR